MDLYERYPATFIVAEGSHGIMGYIMCRIERGFTSFVGFSLTKRAHLVSVAVLPEYQHQGVGTALLKNALKNMPKYGAKECFLEVRVSNTTAVEMYRKLGFLIGRRSQRYYADGEDAYVMEKKLEKSTL
jgi:ribosomal-protein-alanine N-acetyltransferase